MAISATHYRLLTSLKDRLPPGGSLLEIGEANWYGDIEPDFPFEGDGFAACKALYASLFAPEFVFSVDFNGGPQAIKQDLNQPLDLGEFMWCCGEIRNGPVCPECGLSKETYPIGFNVVINHGTAEHIFNIGQVFRTMHDHCIDGGLMIHESPFTGWIDHGFYCLNPTLFYDLAAANCYELVLVAIEEIASQTIIRLESRDHVGRLAEAGELPNNAMLFAALRKYGDIPFKVPMQGYYNQTLSPAGVRAWERNR
jgi:hypothetical protein